MTLRLATATVPTLAKSGKPGRHVVTLRQEKMPAVTVAAVNAAECGFAPVNLSFSDEDFELTVHGKGPVHLTGIVVSGLKAAAGAEVAPASNPHTATAEGVVPQPRMPRMRYRPRWCGKHS